jgi:hypothetical protein
MVSFLPPGLGHAIRTKVGIAVIGAVLVGGGGTAMAMATSHARLPFGAASSSASPTTPGARTTGDQDNEGCTGTPSAHATPGAHSDSDDASEHTSGTPSATRAAGQGDDANEHEGSQDDQDECGGKGTATRTPHPEPTEGPGGDD